MELGGKNNRNNDDVDYVRELISFDTRRDLDLTLTADLYLED